MKRDKTFRKRFTHRRQTAEAEPSWEMVEPGATRAAKWSLRLHVILMCAIAVALVGWVIGTAVALSRWENLRSRGIDAYATVMNVERVHDDDDGTWKYYVDGHIDGCCNVEVAVATDTHPIGSTHLVRYDPHDPTNAESVVDRPADYDLQWSIGLLAASLGGLIWNAIVKARGRRRAHALLDVSRSPRRVRFEAWRRKDGDNAAYYLVLRDAAPSRGEPILCVPVRRRMIGRLEAGTVLHLYGSAAAGEPVVLRSEGRLFAPTRPTQPGSWERYARSMPSDTTALDAAFWGTSSVHATR